MKLFRIFLLILAVAVVVLGGLAFLKIIDSLVGAIVLLFLLAFILLYFLLLKKKGN